MNQFHPQMTSEQIYDTLKEYNETLLDIAVNGTIDEFNQAIEEWNIESVNKTPEYAKAIRAYRMNEPVIFIENTLCNYPIQKLIKENEEIFSQSLIRDVIESYKQELDRRALAMINETDSSEDSASAQKYYADLEDFINNTDATDFYKSYRESSSKIFSNTPQGKVINKLKILINSKCNLSLIFKLNLKLLDDIHASFYSSYYELFSKKDKVTALNNLSRKDDWKKYIEAFNSAKEVIKDSMTKNHEGISDIPKYLSFQSSIQIPFSSYLQGKGINRTTYNRYINGKNITNRLFYYELAFYLGLYNSDIIRKFFATIGFGVNPLIPLVARDNDYEFFEPEILHWVDCGISTNTINEIMGFKFVSGRR
ncbi:MAG: hypothetical protein ACLRZ9_02335 [Eubacterium sp.]